ncbi:MAG: Fe-S cluster assembly protein SufD [Chlamydiota bacterium]
MVVESQNLLNSLYEKADRGFAMDSQSQAWELFKSLGLPTKDKEAFRYLSLQELYRKEFCVDSVTSSISELPSTDNHRFIFVDGVFIQALSSLGGLSPAVVYCTLKEALKTYGSLLKGRFSKFLKETHGGLTFLNHALFEEGFFLYIPQKVHIDKPIEIVELYSSEEAKIHFPKNLIYLGSDAKACFSIQAVANTEASQWINQLTEFHLEARSQCLVNKELLGACSSFYFDHVCAFLRKDAHFSCFTGDGGSPLLRQEFTVELLEQGARAFLKGLSILEKKNQSHHYITMRHKAPHCESHQHFKGVLFDQARLSFEGKICVDKDAQKTQAYQRSNHLLLGKKATAYSKPNLEIFADDVKASHGATIAKLQDEELFYLKARGLDLATAKKLLLKGFCKELIQHLPVSNVVLEEHFDLHLASILDRQTRG